MGGDLRCFILDNHRPIHLGNIYSLHNVVIFDDESEINADRDFIPSDASDISSGEDRSDEESSDEEDKDDDEEEEEEEVDEQIDEEGEEEEEFGEVKDSTNALEGDDNINDKTVAYDGDNDGEADNDEDSNDNIRSPSSNTESQNKSRMSTGTIGYDNLHEEDDRQEEDDDDDEDLNRTRGEQWNKKPKQNISTVNNYDNEEEEENVKIIGRKRKTLIDFQDKRRQRRKKLQSYYRCNASYSAPTVMTVMHLTHGKFANLVPQDLIWQAILGVTDQHVRGNITEEFYNFYITDLNGKLGSSLSSNRERSKYNVSVPGEEGTETVSVSVVGSDAGSIEQCDEYRFYLHRHWSLFEAMTHSCYVASKLAWGGVANNKLHELLAKIGVPLQQSKQTFNFMPPVLRKHFRNMIMDESIADKFGLRNPDVTFKSFVRYYLFFIYLIVQFDHICMADRYFSFRNAVAATDIVYASSALLEMYGHESCLGWERKNGSISSLDAFNEAFDCLGCTTLYLFILPVSTSFFCRRDAVGRVVQERSAGGPGPAENHR